MTVKIDKKISAYEIVPSQKEGDADQQSSQPEAQQDTQSAEIIHMHEKLERPEMLLGSTYKIKTPLSEHALYVTINDIVLNPDTPHEHRRPFEIFINSKNMDHFQWIVALTRIISAVFRKGGDATFMVDELRGVFDPKGGYFKRGGRYIPSLVAEIGDAIEAHMKMIGMINTDLDEHQKQHIEAKRKEYEERQSQQQKSEGSQNDSSEFPKESVLCNKCHVKAMINLDNCLTCLNCGESKCG